jgi:hypothetical protein
VSGRGRRGLASLSASSPPRPVQMAVVVDTQQAHSMYARVVASTILHMRRVRRGARLVRTCTRIGRTYPRNARRDGSGGRGRRRFVPCISCRRRETRVGYPTDTGGWRSATSSSAGRGINRTCWCWCWCWSWPDGRRAHYCQGRTTLMAQALYIWRRQLAHARTQATPATFDLLTETHPKQNATTSCSPAAA